MDIVITGASGFIGNRLVPYLSNRHQVLPVSLRKPFHPGLFPSEYDAVVHLAGIAHDIKGTYFPAVYEEVNMGLTQKVFDLFLHSGARDFIFMSSIKAVAESSSRPLTEEALPRPETVYGASKRKAEQFLLSQPLPEGKRLFILRPGLVYGAGNKGNLNLLFRMAQKGLPYPLGAFPCRRSFLYVDNLCWVIEKMLREPAVVSGIYHVADDEGLSVAALFQALAAASGKDGKVWQVPQAVVRAVASAGTWLHLPLNKERLKKLTSDFLIDNGKVRKALNAEKMPFTTIAGLMKTFDGPEVPKKD